jgi:RHS repeat-associated protein
LHYYANGQQVAEVVGGNAFYVHQDALGSTRLVVSQSGGIKFSTNYIPYGATFTPTGSQTFKYIGQPYDSTTGLCYFGARYYDPSVGRFITQDTLPGDKFDPLTLNLYIYARDNPMVFTDPTGHDWWNPWTWSSQEQAVAFTIGLDVAAGLSVAFCPVLAPTLFSAAFSTTAYTISMGGSATLAGAATSAMAGGVAGTLVGPIGAYVGSGWVGAAVGGAVSNFGGDFVGTAIQNYLTTGNAMPTKEQFGGMLVSSAFGAFVGAATNIATESTLSAVGRPATTLEGRIVGLLNPDEHGRAAWQVYGNSDYGVYALGFGAIGKLGGAIFDRFAGFKGP